MTDHDAVVSLQTRRSAQFRLVEGDHDAAPGMTRAGKVQTRAWKVRTELLLELTTHVRRLQYR